MKHVALLFVVLSTLLGCDRGPEPGPIEQGEPQRSEPQGASAEAETEEAAAAHAGSASTGSGSSPHAGTGEPSAGGLTWDAPAPFEERPAQGEWRIAEYVVPEQKKGQDAANMRVYFFGPEQGGSIDDNVARWKGQFEPPEGKTLDDVSKVEKRVINDIEVTFVDVRGTFEPMQMPGKAPRGPQRDRRMLAAIADGPKGRVFFKLVGPRAVVTHAEGAFEQMLESLKQAG